MIAIQIPCLNEEETIGPVVADIREATRALGDVRIVIIDDGSTDDTVGAARRAGVDYIASHDRNEGLARAYMTGLAVCLNIGADIIVNTDADNQYKAEGIVPLVAPVVAREADMALGIRPISDIAHFSPLKKFLQHAGSRVVGFLSGFEVRDASSGFRAINRETAIRLNTFSRFTYTLETLIQAGRSGLKLASVEIDVNPPTRPSRLFKGMLQYLTRSAGALIRIFTVYAPLRSFCLASILPLSLAAFFGTRYFALLWFMETTRSHAPSLIFAAAMAILGFLLIAVGIVGELISINRRVLEEVRTEQRRTAANEGRASAQRGYTLITVDKNA